MCAHHVNREKREAAKAKGRTAASDSDDVSDPEASPLAAGAEQDGHDPFFQQDDNVFDDPWFATVRCIKLHQQYRLHVLGRERVAILTHTALARQLCVVIRHGALLRRRVL